MCFVVHVELPAVGLDALRDIREQPVAHRRWEHADIRTGPQGIDVARSRVRPRPGVASVHDRSEQAGLVEPGLEWTCGQVPGLRRRAPIARMTQRYLLELVAQRDRQ